MRTAIITASIALALVLTACSPAQTPAPDGLTGPEKGPETGPETSGNWSDGTPLVDEQGAVTVEITPLNLDNPGETLDFQISLDTHSVDLSMDLASLATLTTDKGVTIPAMIWDAPLGGHHVSGNLTFPSVTDGIPVLDGASIITLKLVDVDADERVFVWEK